MPFNFSIDIFELAKREAMQFFRSNVLIDTIAISISQTEQFKIFQAGNDLLFLISAPEIEGTSVFCNETPDLYEYDPANLSNALNYQIKRFSGDITLIINPTLGESTQYFQFLRIRPLPDVK